MICVACYYENEKIVHSINGRCDICNGVVFEDKDVLDADSGD